MGNNVFILRPKTFEEFIGQKQIVNNLKIFINSSKKRNVILDHILFSGGPGLGKTTLAHLVSEKSNSKLIIIQGPALDSRSNLLSILSHIKEGDMIFIDEIHAISKVVEELLYSAMEDFTIDITIGHDDNSKTVRVKIPKFTLIGATTKLTKISKPLKDRFGINLRLNSYSQQDLIKIIINNLNILDFNITRNGAVLLSKLSKRTPRKANQLLKRSIDFALHMNKDAIDTKVITKLQKSLNIYDYGLNLEDIAYLKILLNSEPQPVGIKTLASLLDSDINYIENIIEPDLIKLAFIVKTYKGRRILAPGIIFVKKNNKTKNEI